RGRPPAAARRRAACGTRVHCRRRDDRHGARRADRHTARVAARAPHVPWALARRAVPRPAAGAAASCGRYRAPARVRPLERGGRAVSEFGAVVVLAYNPKVVSVLSYERLTGFGLREALPVAAALLLVSAVPLAALRALRSTR